MNALVIIPVLNNPELSKRAIFSALNQDIPNLRVLAVDQGSDPPTVLMLESLRDDRLRLWSHHPPLPSLAATWNRALQYAWESGCTDALVVNNDVELPMGYYRQLRTRLDQDGLWFLSGVGVNPGQPVGVPDLDAALAEFQLHPDFSAYLITRQCHEKYPFDENFVPAYTEDIDAHRRMIIGEDGQKIGKINVPFLHYASGTLKAMDPEKNRRWSAMITNGSRAYFARKWGGPANQEKFLSPFGTHEPPGDGLYTATPDLRDRCARGCHPYDDTRCVHDAEAGRRIHGWAVHEEAADVKSHARLSDGASQVSSDEASSA